MNDDADGCGCVAIVLGIIAVIALASIVIYLVLAIASVFAVVAGVSGGVGVLYGGGCACRNYAISFKQNVIDSNSRGVS